MDERPHGDKTQRRRGEDNFVNFGESLSVRGVVCIVFFSGECVMLSSVNVECLVFVC